MKSVTQTIRQSITAEKTGMFVAVSDFSQFSSRCSIPKLGHERFRANDADDAASSPLIQIQSP